jgi:FdhD protein
MRIYLQVRSTHVTEVRGTVVAELPLSIYVNGERLVTLLCSPFQVDALVVGHLWMERVIGGIDDIVRIDVSEVDGRATSSSEVPGPCVATYGPMA